MLPSRAQEGPSASNQQHPLRSGAKRPQGEVIASDRFRQLHRVDLFRTPPHRSTTFFIALCYENRLTPEATAER
jgi:hypothetical protein